MPQFTLIPAGRIQKYQRDLADLEKLFAYPLGENTQFTISHGENYADFFARMGKPFFVIATEGPQVVGIFAVVFRTVDYCKRALRAVYISDLKISPKYQGERISNRMFIWSAFRALGLLDFWRTSLVYFIAMVGDKGDVTATAGKGSPLKLFKQQAQLNVYFATPDQLVSLEPALVEEARCAQRILNLSPEPHPGNAGTSCLASLKGVKDLMIVGQENAVHLAHVRNTAVTGQEYIQHLRRAGQESAGVFDQVCFSVDDRRKALAGHLGDHGISVAGVARLWTVSMGGSVSRATFCAVGTEHI